MVRTALFRRVFLSVLAALAIVLSPLAVVAAHAAATVQNDTATTKSGCSVTINVLANDDASGDETVGNLTAPNIGVASVNADQSVTLDLSGAAGQAGTSTFSYDALNGSNVDGTGTVTVTITPATSTDPSIVTACDDTVTVEPNHLDDLNVFNNDDGCGGDCTVSILTQGTDGTATAADPNAYPNATYISNAGFEGVDTVTYELHNNNTLDTDTATVTINVVRRGPADVVLTVDGRGIAATWTNPLSGDFTETVVRYAVDGAGAQFPQTPTDGDGGAVFAAPASSGTVTGLAPGTTYLVSAFAVYGAYGFVGPMGQDQETIAADNPPTVTNKTANTTVNTAVDVNVSAGANDPDGDTLTYTTPNDAAHGSVTCTTAGICTYTPGTDYAGPDSFTFVADDGFGGTATGTVTVNVTSTAVVPTVSAGSWGPASRAIAKVVTIRATVGSVSSGQLVALQRKAAGGSWTNLKTDAINLAGSYTVTSGKQASGSFSYRVAVEDSAHTVLATSSAKTLSFYTASLGSVVKKGHEAVTIKNTGKVSINLKGWTIAAKHGKTVTLPKFTLKAGKSVRVHLTKGKTTGKVIYVNKSKCFGDKHDTLTLRDTKAAGHSVVNTRTY